MTRYCLDRSAYSRFQRGDARVVELVDTAEWIGVPAIVIGELLVGFRLGRARDRNERHVQTFLSHPAVDVLTVDEATSQHYADIVIDLRRHGKPLPTNDIWIAASAASVGAMVLSYDEHFDAIARVGSVVLRGDEPSG